MSIIIYINAVELYRLLHQESARHALNIGNNIHCKLLFDTVKVLVKKDVKIYFVKKS